MFRNEKERNEMIIKAMDFELKAIQDNSTTRNPYYDIIKELPDGNEVWETVEIMTELFNKHNTEYGYLATITLTVMSKYDGLSTIDLTAFGTTKEEALEEMDRQATQYLENPIIIDYRIENIRIENVC